MGQPGSSPSGAAAGVLRSVRPRQWVKNLLVLAAPLASGQIGEPDVLVPACVALLAFCAAASAVYLVNDVVDRDFDRRHPRKRHRPIASGQVGVPTALAVAGGAALLAVGLAAAVNLGTVLLIVTYLALNLAYSTVLKSEPVVDLVVVAAGFLLRAVAGGVAASIFLSDWFLLVAGFGSLFMVAGKRYSELHSLGSTAETRASLVGYSESYLRFVWGIAATTTLVAYCLWAFEESDATEGTWRALSIIPFVIGMLRYAVDIDKGAAGEPEEIIWHDRGLQLVGAAWLALVCTGIFLS